MYPRTDCQSVGYVSRELMCSLVAFRFRRDADLVLVLLASDNRCEGSDVRSGKAGMVLFAGKTV